MGIVGLGGMPKKSKAVSIVLKLMDKDYSYQEALKIALAVTKSKKTILEKELNYWI